MLQIPNPFIFSIGVGVILTIGFLLSSIFLFNRKQF
jgi:hypothetical protein